MGLVQSNAAQNGATSATADSGRTCGNVIPPTGLLADVCQTSKQSSTAARVPSRPAKLGDPVALNDIVADELAARRTQEADAAKLVEGHCSVYNSEVARRGVPVPAARDCIDAERQRYMDARVRMRMARTRGVACSQVPCGGNKGTGAFAGDKRRLDVALDQRERRHLLNKRPTILENSIVASRHTAAGLPLGVDAPVTTNLGAKYSMIEQLQRRVQS